MLPPSKLGINALRGCIVGTDAEEDKTTYNVETLPEEFVLLNSATRFRILTSLFPPGTVRSYDEIKAALNDSKHQELAQLRFPVSDDSLKRHLNRLAERGYVRESCLETVEGRLGYSLGSEGTRLYQRLQNDS